MQPRRLGGKAGALSMFGSTILAGRATIILVPVQMHAWPGTRFGYRLRKRTSAIARIGGLGISYA